MPIDISKGITNESWTIAYDDEEILLEIKRPNRPHSLFIKNRKGFQNRHPWEIFFLFFNELVWFYDITIKNVNGGSGDYCANANFLPSEDSYAIELNCFKQQVFDIDQHLALGFFREGVSSGSPYYAFLCYSKILEIPFKDGKSKGTWIDQEIPNLQGDLSVSLRDRRVKALGGKTLGIWLREDGRHALSHANIQKGNTVRDPNSYQDWDDIKWGNEVMHELAVKAIIEKLGVPERQH
jgi:hypothetical protein